MPDLGPDIGPDIGTDITGAAYFAPDPSIPTGPAQPLRYTLRLGVPAVVTLAGLGYVRQGITQAGPYAVDIGLGIAQDKSLVPVDGLPHSAYVLTMTGVPNPVPGLVTGLGAALWLVLKDGRAETALAVLAVRGGPCTGGYSASTGLMVTGTDTEFSAGLTELFAGQNVYLRVSVLDPLGAAVSLTDPSVTRLEMALADTGDEPSLFFPAAVYAQAAGQAGPFVGTAFGVDRGAYYVWVRVSFAGGVQVAVRGQNVLLTG